VHQIYRRAVSFRKRCGVIAKILLPDGIVPNEGKKQCVLGTQIGRENP
jgi:hypothetical protein